MLTLKVITTDQIDQTEIHLFNGDSISHKEYFSSDHYIVSKVQNNNSSTWIIGNMVETSSKQEFIASDVAIYDEERNIKHLLFICPKAECYVMDNGKTIDSFFCMFKELVVENNKQ